MSDTVLTTRPLAATARKASRFAPGCFIVAALAFAAAWYFVPSAGETDTMAIFNAVTPVRGEMLAAGILQLVAAALYVPAMVGIVRDRSVPYADKLWRPAAVLIVGTLGLATDALDHILAYAMTAPGVDQAAQVEVMQFMQGEALLLISPLIASYFVGAVWLSIAYAKAGAVSRWNPGLYAVAAVIAAGGSALAHAGDVIDSYVVGVLTMWVIAAPQLWLGVVIWNRRAA
jgi:hypothetical protein